MDGDGAEDIKPDDKRLGKLAAKWIALGYEGVGIETTYKGDRSDAVMAFVCECHRAGIDEKVIAACLMSWKIGEHVRDQANVRRALKRTIERAKDFVAELDAGQDERGPLRIADRRQRQDQGDHLGRRSAFPEISTQGHCHGRLVHRLQAAPRQASSFLHGQRQEGKSFQIVMGLGTWWLSQPNRRQYDGGMRFMPQSDEDVVGDTLNLWQGFAVKDRKPDGKSGAAG